MDTLLLLGIIPGTNIQISFGDWLLLVVSIATLWCSVKIIRRRHLIARLALAARQSRAKPAAHLA